METKHTPGPWTVVRVTDSCFEISQDLVPESPDCVGDDVVLSNLDAKDDDLCGIPNEADAYLIAAAPEMLAALRRFIDYENAMDERDDVTGMLVYAEFSRLARSAIAKATGARIEG